MSSLEVNEANCLEQAKAKFGNKVIASRTTLVSGHWSYVPAGCSVQSNGDWAAHWNSNKGVNDGDYTSISASCSACPVGQLASSVPNDDTTCKPACPLGQVLNSNKAATDSLTGIIGATVTVTCNPGWSGSGTTTCGSNLQWSPVRTCIVNSCAATQVANSDKSVADSITGTYIIKAMIESMRIQCNFSYIIHGILPFR